jgi:hypothetical protein
MIAWQLNLNRNKAYQLIYMSFDISQGLNNECNILVTFIKKRENYVEDLDALHSTRNQVKGRWLVRTYYTHEEVEIFLPYINWVS